MKAEIETNAKTDQEEYIEFRGKSYRKSMLPPRLRILLEKYQPVVPSDQVSASWSSDWSDWSDHSDTGKEIVSNVLHKTLQDLLPGRNPSMYPTPKPIICDDDIA